MNYRYVQSPIGEILVAGDSEGLKYVGFPRGQKTHPSWDFNVIALVACATMLLCLASMETYN